jgi:hypothetical protein
VRGAMRGASCDQAELGCSILASQRRSLFIVGAPRTGTTSLAKALAAHPLICFSKPKETHFFIRPSAEGVSVQDIRRRYETAYFRTLGPQHRVIAEGSVSYLYDPEAIRRILEFDPRASFVVGLRNPLELLPSYHARLLFTMEEDVADFEHAWRLQERRSRGEAIPRRCREPRLLQYAEVGRLGRHLRRLIEVAGRDRCFLVLFDDFRADPLRTYQNLLAFAGLPDDGRTAIRHKNENRSYRRGWLQPLVMNPPPSLARLAGLFSETGHTRLRSMVRPLRRRLKKANSERTTRPALPPGLREELAEFFREDVTELGGLLGRDLSHWLDRP